MQYFPAPDVADIAKALIWQHHRHLVNIRVECYFSDDTPKSKGKEVWATMRKITGLTAFLSNRHWHDIEERHTEANAPFFVLTVAYPVWKALNNDQREALVDHELHHAWVDETKDGEKLCLIGHDLEEFAAVVRRHGLWRPDLTAFFQAAGQLEMFQAATMVNAALHDQTQEE